MLDNMPPKLSVQPKMAAGPLLLAQFAVTLLLGYHRVAVERTAQDAS